MWTFALTVTGLGGLWLVARHWQGWILYLVNEVLWLAYGLTIRSTPVIVMSVLWFVLGARNLVVTRRSQRVLPASPALRDVQPEVQPDPCPGAALAEYVSGLRDYRRHLGEYHAYRHLRP